MKIGIALVSLMSITACAQPDLIGLDDIRDARGQSPGFTTVINCSKAPRFIFDKHGEIVETIHPIRHPDCIKEDAKRERQAQRRSIGLPEPDDDHHDRSGTNGPELAGTPTVPVKPTTPRNPTSQVPTTPGTPNTPDSPIDPVTTPPTPALPPITPVEPENPGCDDPDSCHEHPDHDPLTHDSTEERQNIHGLPH